MQLQTLPSVRPLARLWARAIAPLDATPYSALILLPRAAVFSVFFRSGLTKIHDWPATIALFQDEYKVPVLPPEFAATLAASVELGASTLVLLGLLTRPAALMIFGMILTIQLFVYPMAWPDHIQWVGLLAFIIFKGPGALSLDGLIGRLVRIRS